MSTKFWPLQGCCSLHSEWCSECVSWNEWFGSRKKYFLNLFWRKYLSNCSLTLHWILNWLWGRPWMRRPKQDFALMKSLFLLELASLLLRLANHYKTHSVFLCQLFFNFQLKFYIITMRDRFFKYFCSILLFPMEGSQTGQTLIDKCWQFTMNCTSSQFLRCCQSWGGFFFQALVQSEFRIERQRIRNKWTATRYSRDFDAMAII